VPQFFLRKKYNPITASQKISLISDRQGCNNTFPAFLYLATKPNITTRYKIVINRYSKLPKIGSFEGGRYN
jgi:hypothetical protein